MDIEERGVRLRLTIVDTPGEKYTGKLFPLVLTQAHISLYLEFVPSNNLALRETFRENVSSRSIEITPIV